jgi:2-polyprenyl-3-methyl-5-hydroxy-6-metoxy-1,4-benzoquinol methylase
LATPDWPEGGLERVVACPVCGDGRRTLLHAGLRDRLFGAPGSWDLYSCAGCGTAFLDPRPTEATMGLAYERYFGAERPLEAPASSLSGLRVRMINGHLNAKLGYELEPASLLGHVVPLFPKRRWRAEWTVRHLAKPPGGPRLLDVGCGTGEFLVRMRDVGWEVHGIEPDPTSAAVARNADLDVQQAGLEDAQLENGSFNAITLNHVIEHLHNPGAALARCRELLRPGGVVWLATPNIDGLGHSRFGADWFGLDPPRHLVLFTQRSLSGLLRQAGFAAVHRIRAYRADLTYPASTALEEGGDPLAPGQSGWRARFADLRTFVQPDGAEELTLLAKAP